MVNFPDGTKSRDHDLAHEKLEQAQLRYLEEKTPEAREEFRQALKIFTELAMRGRLSD